MFASFLKPRTLTVDELKIGKKEDEESEVKFRHSTDGREDSNPEIKKVEVVQQSRVSSLKKSSLEKDANGGSFRGKLEKGTSTKLEKGTSFKKPMNTFRPSNYLSKVRFERQPSFDESPPPTMQPEESVSNQDQKVNFYDFLNDAQANKFKQPCSGPGFMRNDDVDPNRVLKLVGFEQFSWTPIFLYLQKPEQNVTIYSSADKKRIINDFSLKSGDFGTTSVTAVSSDKKFIFTLRSNENSICFGFESEDQARKWKKDFDQAIIGFRPNLTEKENELNHLIIGKLNNAMATKIITEQEFKILSVQLARKEAFSLAHREPFLEVGPFESHIAKNLPYREGLLEFGEMRIIKPLNFESFTSETHVTIACRFVTFDRKPINWTISRSFDDYRDFIISILNPDGPLTSDAIELLPPYPQKAFANVAKYPAKQTEEFLAKTIENFFQSLLAKVPQIDAEVAIAPPSDDEEDEPPPPPPPDDLDFLLEDVELPPPPSPPMNYRISNRLTKTAISMSLPPPPPNQVKFELVNILQVPLVEKFLEIEKTILEHKKSPLDFD